MLNVLNKIKSIKKFEYYMFIYNIERFHYQLAFVENNFFSKCEDLPKWFKDIFNEKCENKIECD